MKKDKTTLFNVLYKKEALTEADWNKVKELIESNPDLAKEKDGNGFTPLHYAVAYNGNKDIIELLLKSGASMEAKDNKYGHTPLHTAAFWGNIEMLELLLEKGANLKEEDYLKRTPHYYVPESKKNLVSLFLQQEG